MEDNFSTDRERGDGSGGNARDGEWQMKFAGSATAHLLLCGLVPNRPWTGTGPRPRGWGPLPYTTILGILITSIFFIGSHFFFC